MIDSPSIDRMPSLSRSDRFQKFTRNTQVAVPAQIVEYGPGRRDGTAGPGAREFVGDE